MLLNRNNQLIKDVHIASLVDGYSESSIYLNAALLVQDGKIAWLGSGQEIPELPPHTSIYSGQGGWLTPGLIDCHTHLVFGGNRADEFEKRLEGMSYAEIAQAGGGILRTVTATREADFEELYNLAVNRVAQMQRQGVTTIEVKSGYGLDLDTERTMLQVARKLSDELPINIRTTFLGAHTLPTSHKEDPDEYVNWVTQAIMPSLHDEGLIDAVDVFCESIGFSLAHTEQIFEAATKLGIPVKAHVEQLSNLGGSELAAKHRALSVDHIEYLDEAGVKAIAESGTIATLLPGAFYYLNETQKPPIELLRKYKVSMAIGTDFNPGSSPIASLPLMLNMACVLFGLTPEEAWQGVTKNAAKALGVVDHLGTLEVGKQADMVCWNVEHPRELAYQVGINPLQQIWHKGQPLTKG